MEWRQPSRLNAYRHREATVLFKSSMRSLLPLYFPFPCVTYETYLHAYQMYIKSIHHLMSGKALSLSPLEYCNSAGVGAFRGRSFAFRSPLSHSPLLIVKRYIFASIWLRTLQFRVSEEEIELPCIPHK